MTSQPTTPVVLSRRAALKLGAGTVGALALGLRLPTAGAAELGSSSSAAALGTAAAAADTPTATIVRRAGTTRFGTAAALSSAEGTTGGVAFVASGTTFPDALAGGPAAWAAGAPLLLTDPSALPAETASELTRLNPSAIHLLGGTGAVSAAVAQQLAGYGTVDRIAGADRYATAASVATTFQPTTGGVVGVATGAGFADALAASAAQHPILLVAKGEIPTATATALAALAPATILVYGGTSAVSASVASQLAAYAGTVTRIAGADRFETSAAISAAGFPSGADTAFVVSGLNFPDGLAAGPVAARAGAPVLLVDGSLPSSTSAELQRLAPSTIVIVGGPSAVSPSVEAAIGALFGITVGTVAVGGKIPSETAGPYPADGTNGPNVLTQSGIVRSDIRSSFGSDSGVATGVPLTIELTLADAASGTVLPGYAVYLWHCDANGRYSLYSNGVTGENYLRGVQVAGVDGVVRFTSIFPADYSGRWPHIHFEVFSSQANATSGTKAVRTSQLALPASACQAVYATASYPGSAQNMASESLATDNVFSDGVTLQTPTMSGSVAAGYTAALVVGI